MHLPNESDANASASLELRLTDVNVRIEAPERVISLLGLTLSNVPRFEANKAADMTVAVSMRDDIWEIRGADGSRHVLTNRSAMPQIGGAVVSRAVIDVAASRNDRTMRATVLEKDGRALAMMGDDWESTIALATHFHGRGWHYIGSDHALFDPRTQRVSCVQKSLYVNASSLAQLPVRYRGAVEASPWYVTSRGISFYAVDPVAARMPQKTWSADAPLCALLVVDGAMADNPSLDSLEPNHLADERFARLGLDGSAVASANLVMGNCVETCDLIEHWFASLLTAC